MPLVVKCSFRHNLESTKSRQKHRFFFVSERCVSAPQVRHEEIRALNYTEGCCKVIVLPLLPMLQRERERETERQRDRERGKERERERDRERDRERMKQ